MPCCLSFQFQTRCAGFPVSRTCKHSARAPPRPHRSTHATTKACAASVSANDTPHPRVRGASLSTSKSSSTPQLQAGDSARDSTAASVSTSQHRQAGDERRAAVLHSECASASDAHRPPNPTYQRPIATRIPAIGYESRVLTHACLLSERAAAMLLRAPCSEKVTSCVRTCAATEPAHAWSCLELA